MSQDLTQFISIDASLVDAEVRGYHENLRHTITYLVKFKCQEAGFYINGITVQPYPANPSELWVQMPRYLAKGKWRFPIEADRTGQFFKLVEASAIAAVEAYRKETYIPTDDEINNPITLDDFPDDPVPP